MPGGVPDQVARERERIAWSLRQRCWTEARIAAELGVSQPAVSKILARVEKRLLARLTKRADRVKARQTAQLEHITNEAMTEWERSKQDSETVKTTEEGAEGVPSFTTKTETTVKGQTGNPSLLAQAREAMADIRKIWGAEAPTKTDVTSAGKAVAGTAATIVEVRLNGGTGREG